MKILLCAILSLPLILLGTENAENMENMANQTTQSTNIKLFQTDSTKSEKSKKIRPKGLKTKEPDGFMLGIGNVFGGVLSTAPYSDGISLDLETSRVTPLSGVELLLGYKWFFGEKGVFGMRLYGRYEFLYELSAMTNHGSLNYDLLFNFNQNQPFKAGMILGILVGGGRTDYLWDTREVYKEYIGGGGGYTTQEDVNLNNTYDTKFSVGLNIGFRFVIFDRSAIEILFQPQFNIRDKFVYEGFNLHEDRNIKLGNEISLLGMTRFIYTF